MTENINHANDTEINIQNAK